MSFSNFNNSSWQPGVDHPALHRHRAVHLLRRDHVELDVYNLHRWWQDCWWLMITKNTMVKRWPLAMVNETKMTNMIKVTRKTTMKKRTITTMTEKTTMTKWTTVIKRSPPPPSAPDPPWAASWCAPSSCSWSPPWSPPSPGTGWPPPRMKDLSWSLPHVEH